jgi:hypothetical protein
MREAADLERDMVRAIEALGRAVEFLALYERGQLAKANGGGKREPLTDCAQEGLAAARRVLTDLRATRPVGRRYYRHGDPGE